MLVHLQVGGVLLHAAGLTATDKMSSSLDGEAECVRV